MKKLPLTSRNRGFMLLEVIISISIFATLATAFVAAMSGMTTTSTFIRNELAVTKILDSCLEEAMRLERYPDDSLERVFDERGLIVEIRFEQIEDLENDQGQVLPDMWRVQVIGRYEENGERIERSLEGLRYLRLYRP